MFLVIVVWDLNIGLNSVAFRCLRTAQHMVLFLALYNGVAQDVKSSKTKSPTSQSVLYQVLFVAASFSFVGFAVTWLATLLLVIEMSCSHEKQRFFFLVYQISETFGVVAWAPCQGY